MNAITVTQLNGYVKSLLEGDKNLAEVYVRGEISNFSLHYASGHCYFTLKDKKCSIPGVMFKSYYQRLRFALENGMAVVVRASVSLYEARGSYQLSVTDMMPEGEGALALAFAQRKEALAKEGLFDPLHKKPLPYFPQRIGIVTAPGGAALQDILSILRRLCPLCTAVVSPATVQGENAAASLIQALGAVDQKGNCDVLIIGRGGGSLEDLWCFNDPDLARAIFACRTPVISAVGHETDFTICDFVADIRAATPSAAVEMAVPTMEQLSQRLLSAQNRLQEAVLWQHQERFQRLEVLRNHRAMEDPMLYVMKNKEKLDFLEKSLYNSKRIFMQGWISRLTTSARMLDSLSPLRVLDRGYAVVYHEEKLVRSSEELALEDIVEIHFRNGSAKARIEQIVEKGPVS